METSYYDYKNKVLYSGSEQGYVTVSDFIDYPTVATTDLGIALDEGWTLTDIEVCNDLVFIATKNDPDPGLLHIYRAAIRVDDDDDTALTRTNIHPVDAGRVRSRSYSDEQG